MPLGHAVQLSALDEKKCPGSHDTHLAASCVGQSLPVAPVPPEHVHLFVAQTRLFEPLQATVSYSLPAHSGAHVSQEAPVLKYLLPVHEMHLAVLCVGHAVPVAPVPPEHVHVFKVHVSPALR